MKCPYEVGSPEGASELSSDTIAIGGVQVVHFGSFVHVLEGERSIRIPIRDFRGVIDWFTRQQELHNTE